MENEKVFKTPSYTRKAQKAYNLRLIAADKEAYNQRNNEYLIRYKEKKNLTTTEEQKIEEKEKTREYMKTYMKQYMKQYREKKKLNKEVENKNNE